MVYTNNQKPYNNPAQFAKLTMLPINFAAYCRWRFYHLYLRRKYFICHWKQEKTLISFRLASKITILSIRQTTSYNVDRWHIQHQHLQWPCCSFANRTSEKSWSATCRRDKAMEFYASCRLQNKRLSSPKDLHHVDQYTWTQVLAHTFTQYRRWPEGAWRAFLECPG